MCLTHAQTDPRMHAQDPLSLGSCRSQKVTGEGENQKYCIAQVKRPISDIPDPYLTLHLTWTWT